MVYEEGDKLKVIYWSAWNIEPFENANKIMEWLSCIVVRCCSIDEILIFDLVYSENNTNLDSNHNILIKC